LDENFSQPITTFDEVALLRARTSTAAACAASAPAACTTRVLT
jgi:hypothetical protein